MSKKFSLYVKLSLLAIMVTAIFVRVNNILYNSAFLDESTYILIGKVILAGRIGEAYENISWVGGFPLFYPFVTALFYNAGGLLGTRLINSYFGVFSVYLFFLIVKKLKLFRENSDNLLTAIFAGGFFTLAVIPITVSRIANYDVFSFTLFLFGIVFLLDDKNNSKILIISAAFLFLSFLAKYVTVIYSPFLFIFKWFSLAKNKKGKNSLLNFFLMPLLFLLLGYFLFNYGALTDFIKNQALNEKTSYTEIITLFLRYLWFFYLLAFLNFILIPKNSRLSLFLSGLSVVPFLFHFASRNISSLAQHTFLSLVFLLPVSAAVFTKIWRSSKWLAVSLFLLSILYQLKLSLPEIRAFENFWPNSFQAENVLRQNVNAQSRILAESDDVYALALNDKLPWEQVTGPFSFNYQKLEGERAYLKAVDDGYFEFVELDGSFFSKETGSAIESRLAANYIVLFRSETIILFKLNK